MSDATLNTAEWPARHSSSSSSYGRRNRKPLRRGAGLAAVAALHVVLIYALVNGLATKVVQVVTHPVQVHIIEAVKPPPPPPPPEPPKQVAKVVSHPKVPPPLFVPHPEVHVPAPAQAVITHQDQPVPSAPVAEPSAPPVVAARPASREVGVVCPNSDQIRSSITYPQEAQDNNITGEVTIEFTVDADGHVVNEHVAKSADRTLDRAAFNAVKQFHCVGQGQVVLVQVPFSFNLN